MSKSTLERGLDRLEALLQLSERGQERERLAMLNDEALEELTALVEEKEGLPALSPEESGIRRKRRLPRKTSGAIPSLPAPGEEGERHGALPRPPLSVESPVAREPAPASSDSEEDTGEATGTRLRTSADPPERRTRLFEAGYGVRMVKAESVPLEAEVVSIEHARRKRRRRTGRATWLNR